MKKSELSFFGADVFAKQAAVPQDKKNVFKTFDWDKAAQIIKDKFKEHPDLIAEAGLQGDWEYTGGTIFENGDINKDSYHYLSSNWAMPTLVLSWDGQDQEELDCFIEEQGTRFGSDSNWDEKSISILKS